MSYINVMADVKKGLLKPMYLIHGEESYLVRQLEKAVVNAVLAPEERDMNLNIVNGDPQTQELINLMETVPFIGGKNMIVVRSSGLFRSRRGAAANEAEHDNTDERLLKVLANFPVYSHVVFTTAEKVDKRRKLYKTIERFGAVAEAAPLKPRDIKIWLPNKLRELDKRMAADAMEYFLAIVSIMPQISLGFLDSELEKAALYVNRPTITKADLQEILAAIPEISVFAMIDAVSVKDTKKALQLFGEQLAAGEHPVKILSLLNRQVRLLWQAGNLLSAGCSAREIAEELGVMPFIGEKLVKQCRGFNERTLKETVLALAEADRNLKSGRAASVVLEKIIIEMCR